MKFGRLWIVVLLLGLVAAACGGDDDTGGDEPAAATEAAADEDAADEPDDGGDATEVAAGGAACDGDPVRFQLSFFANAQHAGWLVAEQQGFYDDAGVDVELIPGGPTVQPVLALADGSVDVALMDFPELILARAEGAPVTVVAGVYHADPLRYVSLPETGITEPSQLAGVRVGEQTAGEVAPELQAMLAQEGLSLDDIEIVPVDFGIEPVISGEVEVGPAFTFFHAASFEEAGYAWPDDLNVLDPNELGVGMTAQVLAVNDTFLEEHRDAVVCTLRAGLQGWQLSLDDPEAAGEDVLAFLPEGAATAEAQLISVRETNAIVMPEGSDLELLDIDVDGMAASMELLQQFDILTTETSLDDAYDPGPLEEARG